jgi:transglutaminase 1
MATANLLIFTIIPGDDPRQTKGTRISLILSDRDVDKKWGAWIRKNEEKMLSVRINTPPTCYVGVWKLQVETIKKADNKNIIFEYTHDQDIYVLFNPWCEGLFFLLFCACKANLKVKIQNYRKVQRE